MYIGSTGTNLCDLRHIAKGYGCKLGIELCLSELEWRITGSKENLRVLYGALVALGHKVCLQVRNAWGN